MVYQDPVTVESYQDLKGLEGEKKVRQVKRKRTRRTKVEVSADNEAESVAELVKQIHMTEIKLSQWKNELAKRVKRLI